MDTVAMDALRIGLTAAAVILFLKLLFVQWIKLPGLTPLIAAI